MKPRIVEHPHLGSRRWQRVWRGTSGLFDKSVKSPRRETGGGFLHGNCP